MTKRDKKTMTWLAVLLTECGAILLILVMGMLILRCRAIEAELDRMLVESLAAHTVEAGDGAGNLLHYAETALKNADLLIEETAQAPDRSWTEPVVRTFNLVDDRMELFYLEREDLVRADWGQEEPELLERVLSGEAAVSGLISPEGEEAYVVAVRPVEWAGQVVGALEARVQASVLLRQGTHSTCFHSVDSAITGEDGRVVYSSVPEHVGHTLVELEEANGITEQEGQELAAAYAENESGSFNYDLAAGRCYAAWAPIGYSGWRVVQVSQSPNVHIDRSPMVQTTVMLASLVVCGVLAAMIWRQRGKLAEEKLRYDALAQFQDTLLFEYDCKNDSLEFTSNAMEILDLDDIRLEGITSGKNTYTVFHPEEMEHMRQVFRNAVRMMPDQIEHDRVRMKQRDGEYSWYRSQYRAVFNPEGRVIRIIGTLTDISAQMVRELELRRQAQQDELTGLYNRAGVKLIDARLEQISRGILFMLDLDDFKHINDTFGHAAGDKVLVAISRTLGETFRADDIVARWGGDEFVVFLSGSDNAVMAREKAQELLDRVQHLNLEGVDCQISVSIGISSAPTHGRTFETLSAAADEALYDIKKNGKGGYALR